MSNVAKLKKRALEYEQKKQFDKALETYVQILSELDSHVDEADVALYNRVGDLMLRKGDVSAAVDYYERAVDLYADGGFYNNAVALCKKILRNAPGRTSVYYKLGRISARSGFINDAKQNFLEYADRMQRIGEMEEAFRALKEFADLCPDQDDIRLMLADQLVRKDRKAEAIEQLQLLYEKFQSEGRTKEARATVDRMKAIDPEIEPATGVTRPTPKASDLVFLDVDYDAPLGGGAASTRPGSPQEAGGARGGGSGRGTGSSAGRGGDTAPAAGSRAHEPAEPDADLPLLDIELTDQPKPAPEPFPLAASDPAAGDRGIDDLDMGLIRGFEQTSLVGESETDTGLTDVAPLADLESLAPGLTGGSDLGSLGGNDVAEAAGGSELPDASLEIIHSVFDQGGESMDLSSLGGSGDSSSDGSLGGELTLIYPDEGADGAAESGAGTGHASGDGGRDASLAPSMIPARPGESERRSRSGEGQHAHAVPGLPAHEPIARVVDRLKVRVLKAPNDFDLRRQLGEALLEDGEREAGLVELETAMLGYERVGDLRGASAVAEELILVEPNAVRFHQKRVEYAVRANDSGRLAEAYLALAECLFRGGELDKSRAVYARVLELVPDHPRARSALRAFGDDAALTPTPISSAVVARNGVPAPPRTAPRAASGRPAAEAPPAPRGAPTSHSTTANGKPPSGGDADFVNLSEWLREDETRRSTRMIADVTLPSDDEQVDFEEMLNLFKQGVAANVDDTDYESHYDLGVAYKEMGLLDEAISEFQKALRGATHRVRTYEALGQCFVEKEQYQIALTILSRALNDKSYTDDMLVGVLYLLGYASEALGRWDEALRYYERVFAVDIQFRDIGERLAAMERKAR